MITLASWNPVHPNKPYHYQLAGGSHYLKNNIKLHSKLASYVAILYCKIENIKNIAIKSQLYSKLYWYARPNCTQLAYMIFQQNKECE